VLADEGAPMGTLLGKLVAAQRTQQPTTGQVPLDYLGALARSVQTSRDAPGLGERLTARELEVLGLLAAGRSNQRIAEELVVTIDTVIKHVSHVLDKLGAGNRTEAVARARQLGLLR
jgi:LuxR family transcriptional regulator, maltose regulon positive regulatory protein